MKIKINDKETYEIDVDTEVLDGEDFLHLMERLRYVEKMIEKMSGGMNTTEQPVTRGRYKSGPWVKDREEAIKVLTLMYSGTREEKEAYANKFDMSWTILSGKIKSLKYNKKLDIKYEELGLTRWPKQGEQLHDLLIKNQTEPTMEEQHENQDNVQEETHLIE